MKAEIAIVETSAQRAEEVVSARSAALREAESLQGKAERQAEAAREVTRRRRLELGKALVEARKQWPARGPRARGWGEMLARQGIAESTARDLMQLAGYAEEFSAPSENGAENHGCVLPPRAEIRAANRDRGDRSDPVDNRDDQDAVEIVQHGSVPAAPDRGAWCTPRPIAEAVGPWDLDPFSNPRSVIVAMTHCMLEYGDDGLPDGPPGSYRTSAKGPAIAGPDTRVWIQPPYSIVLDAIAHYGHTRFCALLRLDPSTEWFDRLWELTELILVPKGDRLEFIPPPGVEASSNPFPHCLFYARAEDATQAIRSLCYEWRVR